MNVKVADGSRGAADLPEQPLPSSDCIAERGMGRFSLCRAAVGIALRGSLHGIENRFDAAGSGADVVDGVDGWLVILRCGAESQVFLEFSGQLAQVLDLRRALEIDTLLLEPAALADILTL